LPETSCCGAAEVDERHGTIESQGTSLGDNCLLEILHLAHLLKTNCRGTGEVGEANRAVGVLGRKQTECITIVCDRPLEILYPTRLIVMNPRGIGEVYQGRGVIWMARRKQQYMKKTRSRSVPKKSVSSRFLRQKILVGADLQKSQVSFGGLWHAPVERQRLAV
jgi:hypothetical protein